MVDVRRASLADAAAGPGRPGRILHRYFLIFTILVGGSLIASAFMEVAFRLQETRQDLEVVHGQMAQLAALRIRNWIEDVAKSVRLTAQPRAVRDDRVTDDYVNDLRDLLKNEPAIRDVLAVDLNGHEQFRQSRIGRSTANAEADHSLDPYFVAAKGGQIYFGPVVFPTDAFEPRMIIAVPIEPFRGEVIGVLAAEVNVRYVWDVVQEIKVGDTGYAYVVSDTGSLIAHPDLHLVLQHKDLSDLAQVAAALRVDSGTDPGAAGIYRSLAGQWVIASHVRIPSVGWTVLVERPLTEAYRPVLASLGRSGGLLLILCVLAVGASALLGRRVMQPIEALRRGAIRLESGDLDARIQMKTGDEFEELAEDFNRMARRLQDSHATLERKVEERTQQATIANLAKSRFLAAASHDLRQPLHALGLFVGQLRVRMRAGERTRVIERINAAVATMNELFNALLDVSKLDAGAVTPTMTEFPVANLFDRIESTFAEAAKRKDLSLRVIATDAWVRSDVIMLERILFNLVSNAVRYTSRGGVVVGCRLRGTSARIEVWDTGPGIPEDQRSSIFGEFYRIGVCDQGETAGLGLGLSIVDRLCRLLGQPVELTSRIDRGSRFAVTVPLAAARAKLAGPPVPAHDVLKAPNGKLILVIDDDPPILEGMGGLLRSWGCRVVVGDSETSALRRLGAHDKPPDLIISDYQLPEGKTGIETIERLRQTFASPIPAFLISGDTDAEPQRRARACGYHLLHKPVDAMKLRAMVNQLLRQDASAVP